MKKKNSEHHQNDILNMFSNVLLLWCQLILISSITAHSEFHISVHLRERRSNPSTSNGVGDPLFLTPYLERNEIEKAKNLSWVQPFVGNFESYAGFFTVNKTYDSNHFFWFFPASNASSAAPLMVILEGGPGTSSLLGCLGESGPYAIEEETLKVYQREYRWTNMFSLLYIDNPVGTGYSFTKNEKGYCTDEECVAGNLYETVKQFFKMFPEYSKNDLFIHGISYGGKYGPGLAYAIHNGNKDSGEKINLKGVAIANGWSDPINMLDFGAYLYQIGLIDIEAKELFQRKQNQIAELISAGKMVSAFEKYDQLLISPDNLFTNITGFQNYFNYLHSSPVYENPILPVFKFVQQDSIRRQIHAGNAEFSNGQVCFEKLKPDFLRSVAPWIKVLLESDIQFLFYNGAADIIVAYPFTVNFLRKLDWSGAAGYKKATRNIWKVNSNDTEIAGYVRVYRNLHEAMVRNSGHAVSIDQPRSGYDLIQKFVFNKLQR